MKRLLVIGASVQQVSAIRKAKEMGLYVGVVQFIDHQRGTVGEKAVKKL